MGHYTDETDDTFCQSQCRTVSTSPECGEILDHYGAFYCGTQLVLLHLKKPRAPAFS